MAMAKYYRTDIAVSVRNANSEHGTGKFREPADKNVCATWAPRLARLGSDLATALYSLVRLIRRAECKVTGPSRPEGTIS